jgi:thymidylate synthase
VRLLKVFRYSKESTKGEQQKKKISEIKRQMSSPIYDIHIDKRQRRVSKALEPAERMLFDVAELDAQQPVSNNEETKR